LPLFVAFFIWELSYMRPIYTPLGHIGSASGRAGAPPPASANGAAP
jgi:hypothetical protein